MIKSWLIKSTTVRTILQDGTRLLQQHLPRMVARLARTRFTRTNPKAVRTLGFSERPQHTWEKEVEDQKMTVYSWGASLVMGRPVALVAHGWNSNAWDLYPLIESLRQAGYTVVAADQIGHGRSTGKSSNFPQFARNLERLARSLPRLDVFVGHSMGAAAGAVALSRGVQAGAAVLLAPPADVRLYIQRFADYYQLVPAVILSLQNDLERQEKVDLAQLVPEVIVPNLKMPALIFCDRKDREVGLEASQRYARHWPGSRLVVTEGLGHSRITSDPAVLQQLTDFLAPS